MTVEAALALPAFAAIVLVFAVLLRIVMVEAAVQSVAAESVKQLSGAWIPFEKELQKAGSAYGQLDPDNWTFIPDPAKPLLAGFGNWKDLPEAALQQALAAALKPAVWANVPDAWKNRLIHRDRLRIADVAVPHVNDDSLRFGFTLVYEMPVALPFYKRTLEIRKSYYERVWFGH